MSRTVAAREKVRPTELDELHQTINRDAFDMLFNVTSMRETRVVFSTPAITYRNVVRKSVLQTEDELRSYWLDFLKAFFSRFKHADSIQ